ncbi:hypothetical protein HEP73_03057 [Xanthomonas sp. GW]|uniref:hypothetical protein n=1 Tax=Xanthomonas sp. GW TaxID=2724121 RepID=UPI00163A8118|nr:hypothetical protein [Xanthomonas sp. GW]QNH22126.1 hypothetical protein HEP73_03057 [Xanthomonas sp. GW]
MTLKRKVHAIAAAATVVLLATFWSSTLISELFLSSVAVTAVKQGIAYGVLALVLAMAATGATGFSMGGKGKLPLLAAKRKRMPFIAINGLVILIPSALFLASRATAGVFDARFYAVQVLELLVGGINLTLIGLNVRDGLRLSSRRRQAMKPNAQIPREI